jgi:uncharacterized protein HemY
MNLTLGESYRRAKDFKKAKFYLDKGSKRVKKVGDKYSEGFGYKYLGCYFRNTDDKNCKENLSRVYEIFKSIGVKA